MTAINRAVLKGGYWHVTLDPHAMMIAKRLFPKVDVAAVETFKLADNAPNARELLWFAQRFPMVIEPRIRAVALAARQQALESRIVRMNSPSYEPPDVGLALPLRRYQKVAVELATTTTRLLIADKAGLGKTPMGIGVFARMDGLPAVVVTVAGTVPGQWRDKINLFAPELQVHVAENASPKMEDLTRGAYDRRRGQHARIRMPDVIVLNWHKLAGWADFLAQKIHPRVLVLDEAQYLRNKDTEWYRAAANLRQYVAYCVGLSATPIYNYGGEIWNVMEIIAPGMLGSWEEFKRAWASSASEEEGKKPKIIVKDPAALGAHLRASGLMIARSREDVGRELPKITRIRQLVEADTRELRNVNDKVAELARIILDDSRPAQERAIASNQFDIKLRQATGIAKAPAVAYLTRMRVETGEKVLLYGWHRMVYDIWRDLLSNEEAGNLRPAFFTGHESERQKKVALARFLGGDALEKARREFRDERLQETDVLVMSVRSGVGVDGIQHVCSCVVMGELDWSPAVHEQAEDRSNRDGQKTPVVVYYAISEDDFSSDPYMEEVLGVKTVQSTGMLDPHADRSPMKQVDPKHIKNMARQYLERTSAKRRAA